MAGLMIFLISTIVILIIVILIILFYHSRKSKQQNNKLGYKAEGELLTESKTVQINDPSMTMFIQDISNNSNAKLINKFNSNETYCIKNQGSTIVGRDPSCDVVINTNKSVSRKHLKIYYSNGYYLEGFECLNQVKINNIAYKNIIKLNDRDEILIGSSVFLFIEN